MNIFHHAGGSSIYGSSLGTTSEPDPNATVNSALIHANGTDGAQNNTILDSSGANVYAATGGWTITRTGNVTQGSFSPYSNRGYSVYFPGSGYSGFSTATTGQLYWTAGQDFTFEVWLYPVTTNNTIQIVNFGTYQTAYTAEYVLWITGGNASIFISGGSTNTSTQYLVSYPGGVNLTQNAWNHVAVVRSSNNLRAYLNGNFGTTVSAPGAAQPGSARYDLAGPHGFWLGINVTNWTAFSPTYWQGYMADLRYVVGTAVYTANFTVPSSPLGNISNTQMLTLNNPFMKDNGAFNPTYTIHQNRVEPTSPYAVTTAYDPLVHGGSAYFDGSGDYLIIPRQDSLEISNSNFCIEFMFYTTTIGATNAVVLARRTNTSGFGTIYIARQTATVNVYMSSAGVSWDVANNVNLGSITTGRWYHVSVYRIGTVIYGSLNGTITTVNASTSATFSTSALNYYVGTDVDGSTSPFAGYISNLRFVVGSSVYTASSAPRPTAPLTAITGTQVLLNFTNATIVDSTTRNNFETVNTARLRTDVKKFGASALYFDGGSFLKTGNVNNNLIDGTADFTIEAWIYPTALTGDRVIAASYATWATSVNFYFGLRAGTPNILIFRAGDSVPININGNTDISLNTWTHVAVSRVNGVTRQFVGGVAQTSTHSGSVNVFATKTNVVGIGANPQSGNTTEIFVGYIDELRFSRYGRYSATFTPPTSQFADK
jgi:hypothetical protein